jgi:hypothetical protein
MAYQYPYQLNLALDLLLPQPFGYRESSVDVH